MRRIPTRTTTRAAMLALALLAVALLAACGSSSKPASTQAAAAASPSTTSSAPSTTSSTPSKTSSTPSKTPSTPSKTPSTPARAGARFTALRECLAKQGVKLPQGSAGKGAAGAHLPAGVSRSQFQAAFRKCGGGRAGLLATPGKGYSAAFKKELADFAACMRQNGVDMPAPDTSGKGPIFATSRLDTTSPAFRAARQKCVSHLRIARPGTSGKQ